MKKTFTVIEVPGSKRTSPRNYTHAVIGQFNHARHLTQVDVINATDLENFDYSERIAKMQVGDLIHVTGCPTPWSYAVDQEAIDRAKGAIAGYNTRDEFAAAMRASRVAAAKADEAKNAGKWQVLRWSMSYANACKGHNEFPYMMNLKVVPTKEVTK